MLRDCIGQVGHLGSHCAAAVGGRTAEAAGPVHVANQFFEGFRVADNESPQQNTEEHVLGERIDGVRLGDTVGAADRLAVLGDAGRDVRECFLYACVGQEGGEEDHVALGRPLLTSFGGKAQAQVAPGPGLLGEMC